MKPFTGTPALPEFTTIEKVLENARSDLAVGWDGTTIRVAYAVDLGDRPTCGWLGRSGSADRLLEHADQIGRTNQPQAKAFLQEMAAEVLNPTSRDKLQCVVMAENGAALADLNPEDLGRLKAIAKGNLPEDHEKRRALIWAHADDARSAISLWEAEGQPRSNAVLLMIDPQNERGKLSLGGTKATAPTRLVTKAMSVALAYGGLEGRRPDLADQLAQKPSKGTVWVVCWALDGQTLMQLPIAAQLKGETA